MKNGETCRKDANKGERATSVCLSLRKLRRANRGRVALGKPPEV